MTDKQLAHIIFEELGYYENSKGCIYLGGENKSRVIDRILPTIKLILKEAKTTNQEE
jgi:hypothetical protein